MGFLESILMKIGTLLADRVIALVEQRLKEYFEFKGQISAISKEANSLKEELKNATTDAERFQILRKIGAFNERIGL